MTPLAKALESANMTQQRLADLIGTSKQQINKLVHQTNKMTLEWAHKIAPHVGIPWPELMGWDQKMIDQLGLTIAADQAERATGTSHTQPARAPQRGQFIDEDSELSLLAFWRGLNDEEKRFMLSLLRNGALGKV